VECHSEWVSKPGGECCYRARTVRIDAQNCCIERALALQTWLRRAIVGRRSLSKVQQSIRSEPQPISLVFSLAREAVDYGHSLIGNIISIRVPKANNTPNSPAHVAGGKQVSVRAKRKSKGLRHARSEGLDLVDNTVAVVVEQDKNLGRVCAHKQPPSSIERHRNRPVVSAQRKLRHASRVGEDVEFEPRSDHNRVRLCCGPVRKAY
jgi:hypothetical protein